MELDFRPFDADNHYYEPLDAFTRHQDPRIRRRGVQVLRDGVPVRHVPRELGRRISCWATSS